MNLRKSVTAAIVAVSLVAAPTFIQAAQAQTSVGKLSVRSAPAVRQGARTEKKSNLAGGSLIFVVLAVVAVGLGIAVAADSNSTPRSPA